MDAKVEKNSLVSWSNGYESSRKSSWFRSSISDLEENTKDLLTLIRLEDGDSFAKRAEMYYHKKPEIEKRIEDFHRLCQLLVDYSSQIFTLSSSLSSRRFDSFHGDHNKFTSSDSNPESVVEDPELDCHAKIVADGFGFDSKDRMGTNPSESFVLVEDYQADYKDESDKIGEKFVEGSEIFRPLEQLVEDNFNCMSELSRRLDERRRCNKELMNQIEKVMRENQLLKNEINSLHVKLQNQTSEDINNNTLICSRCLKRKVKDKSSKLSRMKSLFLNAFCVGEKRSHRRLIEHDRSYFERESEIARAE